MAKLTPQQEEALGQLVCDHFGANIQTGYMIGKSRIYVKVQHTLGARIRHFEIDADGTVIET